MIKYIVSLFLLISCITFSEIRDTLEIIPKEDATKIEKKIKEISRKNDIKIYVNTFVTGEGFQVADPEKTIILNLNRDKEKIKVNLLFSRDIDIEDEQNQIDLILENSSSLLVGGKIGEYIYQILDGVEYLLESVHITTRDDMLEVKEEMSEFKKGLFISFFIILLLASKIVFDILKKRRKNQ